MLSRKISFFSLLLPVCANGMVIYGGTTYVAEIILYFFFFSTPFLIASVATWIVFLKRSYENWIWSILMVSAASTHIFYSMESYGDSLKGLSGGMVLMTVMSLIWYGLSIVFLIGAIIDYKDRTKVQNESTIE